MLVQTVGPREIAGPGMPEGARELRKDFVEGGREALVDYLSGEFPEVYERSPEVSEIRGGRRAAEERLAAASPQSYAKTRNRLGGAVTVLSPYIRHGVMGAREVRDSVLERAGWAGEKLVQEVGWHDYFQRVYRRIGTGVWEDREEWKTGLGPAEYADVMPEDLLEERTGLACMDGFARDLHETGYLHNHARLWTAAYVIHHRRVKWQAGAAWFLRHLLDGDPASNNLSWQWVASTFSSKPYFFDRGNLERNTDGAYCRVCPLSRGGCPFDAPIEELQEKLFPQPAQNFSRQGDGGKGGRNERRRGRKGGRR